MKNNDKLKYISITQLVESGEYPFTLGQMRTFLLYRKENGLHKAVRKIGKRLYIRVDLFDEWIESSVENDENLEVKND